MTISEEFISVEEDLEAAPSYPTVFGVTLTPTISGALLAVVGVCLGGYLFTSFVTPAMQQHDELTAKQNEKQNLVQQKSASMAQKQQVEAELAKAKRQKTDVLALFSNESTLDTLLIDLNRLVQSVNGKQSATAKLKKFTPANQSAETISDGSFGTEVNGKLKRRIVDINISGTFEQTQSILRSIERLQPLLIVRDYQSNMVVATDKDGKRAAGAPNIDTSFKLQALIPVSPEEAAAAAAAAKPAEEKK
jgi:type IV pilus assembly protein PilO